MRAVGVFVDVAGCVCGGFAEKRLSIAILKKEKVGMLWRRWPIFFLKAEFDSADSWSEKVVDHCND